MPQRFDVSLKTIFLHEGDGIIRRLLFGGRVTEHLPTEQPQVSNLRADMVARTEDGEIHHVEFQTTNDTSFPRRMFDYYYGLTSIYRQHVIQTVLYAGREPLRLATRYTTPVLEFRFEVINLRELDAGPLLASDDWADIVLALLAKGDYERVLAIAVPRLREMSAADRAWASGTLILLSGILGIAKLVHERMKEANVINVMENEVLAPLIIQQYEKGRDEGRQEAMQTVLIEQLTDKFGPLPAWATARLQSASNEDLHTWAKRVLHTASLEDTLR